MTQQERKAFEAMREALEMRGCEGESGVHPYTGDGKCPTCTALALADKVRR